MSKISIGRKDITSIEVDCTWGEGADVSAVLNCDFVNHRPIDYHDDRIFLDLTIEEAAEIGLRFTQAADKAREMREEDSYHRLIKGEEVN